MYLIFYFMHIFSRTSYLMFTLHSLSKCLQTLLNCSIRSAFTGYTYKRRGWPTADPGAMVG